MDPRQEVMRAAEARALALATGDADRLRSLLHKEFRWTSHAGETFDRDDYIHRNTAGAVTWRSQRLSDVDVTVVGDAAVLRAEVTDVLSSGNGVETFRMPMTQVWIRHEGAWQCLAGHAGPRRS